MSLRHVPEDEFRRLLERRAQKLWGLLRYLAECDAPREVMTRPFLGDLLSQAIQVEEILDSYEAGKNCRWCRMRFLTATVKSHADLSYELLHIRHRAASYRLVPGPRDFVGATEQALEFTDQALVESAREMVERARALELNVPEIKDAAETYAEPMLLGHLPHDCGARRVETVAETVALLATSFLNLASASEDVRAASRAKPKDYPLYLASSLREERLRTLEFQFHNLQSQYDTYVSGTEVEREDVDLPVLRGHASVVFHLLKTATLFAHYYERHVNKPLCAIQKTIPFPIESDALLATLMNYSITFIDQYIGSAVSLCQEMLKRYAEVGRIELAIPKYRGFHVRPSTLVAKLVLHYGSEVQMHLAGDIYDAGAPLDLFRANEKINAEKRRWLAREIVRLELVPKNLDGTDLISVVRSVALALAAKGKLILYEQPLQLADRLCPTEGTLIERVTNETGRLLALGKIDIGTDITAKFVGDKRVLADIRLLAEYGYGEDRFGNNIALPEKLAYLRR